MGHGCPASSLVGVTTGVLANLWVDDTPQRERTAQILSVLEGHFDLVLRSCFTGARVPEPAMFNMALEKLGLTPQQVLGARAAAVIIITMVSWSSPHSLPL